MNRIACTRCLYDTSHPFGIAFNEDGVCTGCQVHEEKTTLNWVERFNMLAETFESQSRVRRTRDYDCVVPVRGTPEYFYLIDLLQNKLGLRTLAVSYNSQLNSIVGIRNLARLRENFDLDFLNYTSNPVVYKNLVRESVFRLGSMRWPFAAGETQFAVSTAIQKGIPFVIWPTNQATEQVGAHSYTELPEMSRAGWHNYDLMGVEPTEMVRPESLVSSMDIEDLIYPSDRRLSKSKVRGLYMSNYVPWDSRSYSEYAVDKLGALSSKNSRTFDTYDRIDDFAYMAFHDQLKQAKYGYSRVRDSLCREIRFNRISREDARQLEAHFTAQDPTNANASIAKWLNVQHRGLDWIIKWKRSHEEFFDEKKDSDTLLSDENLSGSALEFMKGFLSNTAPVHADEKIYLYGKGLEVNEKISSR